MAQPALDPALAREAWEAYVAAGHNQTAAADALGMARGTFQGRLRTARQLAKDGKLGTDPVIPGFEITKVKTVERGGKTVQRSITQSPTIDGEALSIPSTHRLGLVTSTIEPDGRISKQWARHLPGPDGEAIAQKILERFEKMEYAIPTIPEPAIFSSDYLNLVPLADLHMGLMTWAKETGENWDLKIARRVYTASISRLMARLPAADTCVVLGGGDQMHADNNSNVTPNSGHSLDVDGRYDKVVEVTQDLFLDIISMALQRHSKVIVRILKGNHDEHASTAIVGFLRGAFRNNPRVDIVTSPSKFWRHQHGLTMLAATHGDQAKPKMMPGIMAARWAEMWGATKFRYAHCFHVHHRERLKDESGGAIVDTYTSPAPQDAWHYGMGFISSRLFEAATYSKFTGWSGNIVEPVIPECSPEREVA